MSKFSKILVSLSFAFIVAFSFMFVNLQPLFVKADSISTYNVDFISPNNDILYSLNVSGGSSLQDLQDSNLIEDSYFKRYSSFSSSSSYINWYLNNGSGLSYSFNSSLPYLTINSKTGSNTSYLIYDLVTSQYYGKTLTFSICVDNVVYSNTYTVPNSVSSGTGNAGTVVTSGMNIRFYCYSSSRMGLTIDFYTPFSGPINIYWVKCEVSPSYTSYFDSSYMNELLSSYNSYGSYYEYDVDYSQPINSNKFFYPQRMIYSSNIWILKNWGGLNGSLLNTFNGENVWTDGVDYYYSSGNYQYVLDVSSNTWVYKNWNGLTNFVGRYVWTDGVNYYYSYGPEQYVLNVSTSTWSAKSWSGLSNLPQSEFNGVHIWSDGVNYYFSSGSYQYVLNVSTSTWSTKSWSSYSSIYGENVWTDGGYYYYSDGSTQKVLSGSTWSTKSWSFLNNFIGQYVWTDGSYYYYSYGTQQYVLSNSNTWVYKNWNGLTNFDGRYVWNSDFGIFYSYGTQEYVLSGSLTPIDSSFYYSQGYNDGFSGGYNNGYNFAYNIGYTLGVEEAGNYTFFSLISAVMDAPLKVFYGLFNFELMGVNLAGFIQALLSLAILLFIIRFALQK